VIIDSKVISMRRIVLREMQNRLKAKGIPEYADVLRRKYGYDSTKRKRRLNPCEQELIDEARRKSQHPRGA